MSMRSLLLVILNVPQLVLSHGWNFCQALRFLVEIQFIFTNGLVIGGIECLDEVMVE